MFTHVPILYIPADLRANPRQNIDVREGNWAPLMAPPHPCMVSGLKSFETSHPWENAVEPAQSPEGRLDPMGYSFLANLAIENPVK